MDYACPEKRKGKCDRKAKGRFAKYKRGGFFRTTEIKEGEKKS
jgi:hypothetical protein